MRGLNGLLLDRGWGSFFEKLEAGRGFPNGWVAQGIGFRAEGVNLIEAAPIDDYGIHPVQLFSGETRFILQSIRRASTNLKSFLRSAFGIAVFEPSAFETLQESLAGNSLIFYGHDEKG
jgi:hypothetical protein